MPTPPPPLPVRPALTKSKSQISNLAYSSSSPSLLEPASYEGLVQVTDKEIPLLPPKPREPIYDVIPENIKKKKLSRPPKKRAYEEIVLPDFDGDIPRLWVPPEKEKEKQGVDGYRVPSPKEDKKESPSISLVSNRENVKSRLTSNGPTSVLSLEDLRENWTAVEAVSPRSRSPVAMRRRQAKSFSSKRRQSLMFKRNSSERGRKLKASTLQPNMGVSSGYLCMSNDCPFLPMVWPL